MIVVADGVGGWEAYNIDSGLFSKELVGNIQYEFNLDKQENLKNILKKSV